MDAPRELGQVFGRMQTLTTPFAHESEIKRSRFVARAAPIREPAEALAFVQAARDPDATHNGWAYRAGDAYRFSDDGEPGGTAGRPILAAIDAQALDCVVVLVARWFGGVKLGAGGLARAYGGVAAECLRRAHKTPLRPEVVLRLTAPFDAVGEVHRIAQQHEARKRAESYDDRGIVLDLALPADREESLRRALADATRGRAAVGPSAGPVG
jgi:putative IMPACT (imprinted ancient) family translation regulator